ncbi:MAG: hypothetical protein QMD86_02675 [Patescibacteria group bacterium]|nr:hypothetical protein [Patescibacteria group bacterium]
MAEEEKTPKWAWKILIIVALVTAIAIPAIHYGKKIWDKITVNFSPEAGKHQAASYVLNKDEEKLTFFAGPGTFHIMESNKPFIALSKQKNGVRIAYEMPAGKSSWEGGGQEGQLRLKGKEDGTTVKVVLKK